MTDNVATIVTKVNNMSNYLYSDGVAFNDYLEQITCMLFLKMVEEQYAITGNDSLKLPEGCSWNDMKRLVGTDLEEKYKHILDILGKSPGILGEIYNGSMNRINTPASLQKVVNMIDEVEWSSLSVDVKGDVYEGLLAKNAENTKSGAGQYFTPRPLIQAIVEVMQPSKGIRICDPACGSGGFLLAAQRYILEHNDDLDRDDKRFLKKDAFNGFELVRSTYRLCLMNMFLHGIGDLDNIPVKCQDSLLKPPSDRYDMVLANPPFGNKSALKSSTGEKEESGSYSRSDFWVSTSNKQLNFVQHINSILKSDGRAAIVVPDNVLFEDGAGAVIRKNLLRETNLHTILRLPTGIFYRQGVKANVIFFDKKPAGEKVHTKEVWVYDLRANKHFTLKKNPMKFSDLADFIQCFNADDITARRETYSEENPQGRWRRFDAGSIYNSDKASLDLKWMKDDSGVDLDEYDDPLELIEQYKREVQELSDKIFNALDKMDVLLRE